MVTAKQEAAYHRRRERAWAKQGILVQGKPLLWEQFDKLLDLQDDRCAICEHVFFKKVKPQAVPDHDHKTGELRGILCSGRTGCNFSWLSRYEKGKRFEDKELNEVLEHYLKSPPARLLDAD